MRMTGYEAFTLHNAINLHFNGAYDCFKYNFKTNVTEKTYWKRPDKFQLTKIGKRFNSRDDIVLYFAAHQVAGNKYSGDMIRDEDTYTNFLKVIDSVCIINKLTGFIDRANKQITETILWPDLFMKISKYQSFLKFDDNKFKGIIVDIFK